MLFKICFSFYCNFVGLCFEHIRPPNRVPKQLVILLKKCTVVCLLYVPTWLGETVKGFQLACYNGWNMPLWLLRARSKHFLLVCWNSWHMLFLVLRNNSMNSAVRRWWSLCFHLAWDSDWKISRFASCNGWHKRYGYLAGHRRLLFCLQLLGDLMDN